MHAPTLLPALAIALLTACSGTRGTTQTVPSEATQVPAADTDAARAMGLDPADRATPTERADRQTMFLTERLSLREDQIPAVREVALEYAERQQALRNDKRGDRRAMMQGMRALSQEQDAAYEAILDGDQYAGLQEVRREVREKVRERMQERRGARRGDGGR